MNITESEQAEILAGVAAGLFETLGIDRTPILEVCDNGPGRDGALVINARLTDGRMLHCVFEEGMPLVIRTFDR